MRFTKMQGTGNDFIVIEAGAGKQDWPKLAVSMCDRHFGVGADGILLLMPSKTSDFRMRIYNSDGSEAEMCGNGLRCLVRYFAENKIAKQSQKEFKIETEAGVRTAWLVSNADGSTSVRLSMGKPRFNDDEIPVTFAGCDARVVRKPLTICTIEVGRRDIPLALVSMGNPHAIYFTDRPVTDFPLTTIGPKIERHMIFPEGTNFEVVRVRNRHEIDAVVWERGAGVTLACGTGACAVAVAAHLNGMVDDKVAVNLPGGTLDIEWPGSGEVFLTGPAEFVYSGEWQG
jgi:diaminopimelate epimerase